MSAEALPLRRMVYALLVVVAAGALAGRILSVERVYEPSISRKPSDPESGWSQVWPAEKPEPTPTFSSNDRSRWATVRALVDEGHYWIGYREFDPEGGFTDRGFVITEPSWFTIDKVLDPNTGKFYSSKPPLLATMMAGEYWLLKHLFGCDIATRPWPVVLVGLFTANWLPLVVYLILLARLVERFGTTDWGRLFVLAAGCFATLPTAFAVTFNNHTIAACSALFALYAALSIDPHAHGWQPVVFALAGFFAAFAACCEMPATALAVAIFVFLLVRSPKQTLLFSLPAALVPVGAYFITNYLAVGELLPVQTNILSPWYQFEGSNFKFDPNKINTSIDRLDEPKAVYAFHLLLGHHGLFSLTPIWLLALGGTFIGIARMMRAGPVRAVLRGEERDELALFAALALVLTVVVVTFYIFKTNNYGGWTNGPRWLMWLTPLLLLALLPAADGLANGRWTRAVGYVLLAMSVLAVSYRDWNPWRHPWVYNWMQSMGLGY